MAPAGWNCVTEAAMTSTPHPLAHIAVFGEALADLFASGPLAGGAPFNVARHLAALGQCPLFLSAVGQDAQAIPLLAEFDRFGLRQDGLQILADRQTGAVDVHTDDAGQHRFEIRGDCAYDHIGPAAVLAMAQGLATKGWLYYGSLGLRGPLSRQTWQALLATHQGPRYMDLNWREGQINPAAALLAMAQADVLKVNEDELAMVLAWTRRPAQVLPVAWNVGACDPVLAELMRELTLSHLVVTCGAGGYAAFAAQGLCIARDGAARRITVVDTVGAGDSFSAVMLTGLLRAWPWPLTLARANALAAHVCEVRGAMPVSLEAHRQWTQDWGLMPPECPGQTIQSSQTRELTS